MSNVYNTRFEIRIKDKEKAMMVYSEVKRLGFQKESPLRLGSLEDLVTAAGLGNVSNFKTLGDVCYVGCGLNCITVITNTEDEPPFDVIKALVEKYCPEAKITYYAKNPSIGSFETNNPNYASHYVVLRGRNMLWDNEVGVIKCFANRYGKDSEVLKGFVDGCFNEDGSIDCKKANEYFAAVEKFPDDLYVTSIHKWKITNFF